MLRNLSNKGARHDNDYARIANIQILLITQEIASLRQEYLLLINLTQHYLLSLAGLLDKQFRLLRKDIIRQLQDVVREEVIRLAHLNCKVLITY